MFLKKAFRNLDLYFFPRFCVGESQKLNWSSDISIQWTFSFTAIRQMHRRVVSISVDDVTQKDVEICKCQKVFRCEQTHLAPIAETEVLTTTVVHCSYRTMKQFRNTHVCKRRLISKKLNVNPLKRVNSSLCAILTSVALWFRVIVLFLFGSTFGFFLYEC